MSATAFLIARKGDKWSLDKAATPIQVGKHFKEHVSRNGDKLDEVLYFDTRGRLRRKRFRHALPAGKEVDSETGGDEGGRKGRASSVSKK